MQNSLQSSEPYDIRLEDFFWTGSGDGPPSYRKSIIDKSNARDTIITTSTVVATVYIDGNMVTTLFQFNLFLRCCLINN